MTLSMPHARGFAIRSLPQARRELPPISGGLARLESAATRWTIEFHPREEEHMTPEIVVGLDDSAGARDALAFATRLASCAGASVRLATAFNYSDFPSRASNEAYRQLLEQDSLKLLRSAAESVDGVSGTEAIADPSAPHALHSLAEAAGAALLVVGSTRRGPVGRVVPGSTGERLLHGSPCPVAIVPRGYAKADAIRSIGVAYDGSEESEAALQAGYELARHCQATLRVIRVFDATRVGTPALMTMPGWDSMRDETEAIQRKHFAEAVAALPTDVGIESVFVTGSPASELASESWNVDLMVVGSRGYGPRSAVLLGGVTHTLIRKAACPVVVLPRGARGIEALFGPRAEATAS
jgi:nucleotide-binding universal stress UspA family protein